MPGGSISNTVLRSELIRKAALFALITLSAPPDNLTPFLPTAAAIFANFCEVGISPGIFPATLAPSLPNIVKALLVLTALKAPATLAP